jgi:hypothetical protein
LTVPCNSRFTIDRKTGAALACERHLKSNPFRGEGFVHCSSYGGLEWTWTTEEDDAHDAAR